MPARAVTIAVLRSGSAPPPCLQRSRGRDTEPAGLSATPAFWPPGSGSSNHSADTALPSATAVTHEDTRPLGQITSNPSGVFRRKLLVGLARTTQGEADRLDGPPVGLQVEFSCQGLEPVAPQGSEHGPLKLRPAHQRISRSGGVPGSVIAQDYHTAPWRVNASRVVRF